MSTWPTTPHTERFRKTSLNYAERFLRQTFGPITLATIMREPM